jgi:hypothetical protein
MSFWKNDLSSDPFCDINRKRHSDEEREELEKDEFFRLMAVLIMPAIDEGAFECLYSSNPATRPNAPVNILFGALIIKTFLNMTDHELMRSIREDRQVKYALHILDWKRPPFSKNTLSRFRCRLARHFNETGEDPLAKEVLRLFPVIAEAMELLCEALRTDTCMSKPNAKDMSRLEVCYATVKVAVKIIFKICGAALLADLGRYLDDADENATIYRGGAENREKILQRIIDDGVKVMKAVADKPSLSLLAEIVMLDRLFVKTWGATPKFLNPKNPSTRPKP